MTAYSVSALVALGMFVFAGSQNAPPRASVMVFLTSDCPISNYYASNVQQMCSAYSARGVACRLVYEDVDIDESGMRRHGEEFGYRLPASLDHDRAIARRLGATVTPQVVLTDEKGEIRYRGRIDNRYEAFGRPRRVVTARNLRDAIDAVLDGRRVRTAETTAIGCHIVFPGSAGTAGSHRR